MFPNIIAVDLSLPLELAYVCTYISRFLMYVSLHLVIEAYFMLSVSDRKDQVTLGLYFKPFQHTMHTSRANNNAEALCERPLQIPFSTCETDDKKQ